jgi:hypothetical protein
MAKHVPFIHNSFISTSRMSFGLAWMARCHSVVQIMWDNWLHGRERYKWSCCTTHMASSCSPIHCSVYNSIHPFVGTLYMPQTRWLQYSQVCFEISQGSSSTKKPSSTDSAVHMSLLNAAHLPSYDSSVLFEPLYHTTFFPGWTRQVQQSSKEMWKVFFWGTQSLQKQTL